MDKKITQALAQDMVIDITTTGRKSGRPRRIEIWFHRLNGRYYITGLPGQRSWYANLKANPQFTFHLKGRVQADLAAQARDITDPSERRVILSGILKDLERGDDLDSWVSNSPLVEVTFAGLEIVEESG